MKINGSLVFDASSASEIKNLRVEKYANFASVPAWTSASAGRLVYTIDTGFLYYGDSDSWTQLASGGSAFSQTEGDAIEASLGAGIAADGTFFADGFTDFAGVLVDPTSFTDAINQLATNLSSSDNLYELNDVTLSSAYPITAASDGIKVLYMATTSTWADKSLVLNDNTDITFTSLATGDFLMKSAGNWVNHVLVLDDVTDVTALFGDVNLLTGAAAGTGAYSAGAVTSAMISYLGGATPVTSSIQAQLNGKQALDADLTALSALSGTGIVVRSAADTYVLRTLVAPAAGITITDPAGIAGNPTFALANDLAALEGLTTTGYIVRTGDGTATTRTIAGTATRIVVTNGDGVASNTDIDLATVTQGSGGSFVKVTLDAYGRVSQNTPVVVGDITTLVDTVYVNTSGDTMTGTLNMGTNFVTMDNPPTTDTQAANKAYVDAVAAGLSWKNAVRVATTANVALATDLENGDTVDGITLATGNRVLVKNQSAPAENGIYVVQASGAAVRSTDLDVAGEFMGATVFVTEGTAGADTGWTQTSEVVTVGTTAVTWVQFSGGNTYIWGTGLGNTGNTVFVKLGAGIVELPSDEVGIDVVSNLALQLTGVATGDQLTFVLAGGSGLSQSASGLTIAANGVTNAMILNESHALNADSGTGTLALGDTLIVVGSSVQGINTSVTGQTFTITAANASSSQKGVASFDAGDFTVTAGNVVIAAAGVDNAQLANSTLNFVGSDASADTVALGESLTFVDGASHAGGAALQTSVATNQITTSLREATVSVLGVASFNTAHFSVTAGAVDLAATLDDLTNVSTADAAATNSLLQKSAGDWVAVSPATVAGTMLLGDLSDVTTAPGTDGYALIGQSGGATWAEQKIYHLHTQGSTATTWTVTHSLGQQYCNVTVVDATDEVVIPQSITFDSTTQLTVTFNTAIAGKVVVMGIA